ncbi:MAG: DUF998 domain-containing protein [Promethearchaeota archaeon]
MNFAIKIISKGNAGLVLFVGSVQWLMMMIILESFQPDYNSSLHYVSSLGVGTTSIIYNISIFLFGLSVVISSSILYKTLGGKIFPLTLLITGLLVMGVGLFPENVRPIHGYVTAFAFLFAVFAPILSFKALKPPLSYISIIIGLISLTLLIVFLPYLGLPAESTIQILGFAKGTLERMIIYPLMFWMLSLSVSLFNKS